ncbi:MAG: METTL5 family protein [Thermoplasmatota archaeon]
MKNIKKKDLEIKLEKVPYHPNPSPDLEQYNTPASLASDVLFTAFINGHIKGEEIIDLGCGTGIFSLGAGLLGAESVVGFDIDKDSIETARRLADEWGLEGKVSFEKKDISQVDSSCDTVIMNPPFGSQKKGADVPFLEKSFKISDYVYTIHNAKTLDFLRKFITKENHEIFLESGYKFTVKKTFDFHTKDKKDFDVVIFGIKV